MEWQQQLVKLLILSIGFVSGCSKSTPSVMSASQATPTPKQNLELLHERAKSEGIHLTETEKFPPEYREIVSLLQKEMPFTEAGEYYLKIEPTIVKQPEYGFLIKELDLKDQASVLAIHFWHITAFTDENRNLTGNPGGKCFTRYYDIRQKKLSRHYWWA